MRCAMFCSLSDETDFTEEMGFLKDAGYDAVFLHGDAERIEAARAQGLDVYTCTGAYSRSYMDGDEYLSVDVNGESRVWFNSTCPNRPEVRRANIRAVKSLSRLEGIGGVFLDGARFASPCSGLDAFFTCFCQVCERKAKRMGLNLESIRRDVKALYNSLRGKGETIDWGEILKGGLGVLHLILHAYPGVSDWLKFRRICTTEHILNVSRAVKETNPSHKFGVFIFTPTLSPLVGQSYIELREAVDVFSPMIYRNYPDPNGPACLNTELAKLPTELKGRAKFSDRKAIELLWNLCGYKFPPPRTLNQLLKGLPPEAVGEEARRARALLGGKKVLIPIILLEDKMLEDSVSCTLAGGADGVAFFAYKKGMRRMAIRGTASILRR
ncbi:MAG: hypothetical protein ACUVXI_14680 [bacterium]